jgi:hypothetical protein
MHGATAMPSYDPSQRAFVNAHAQPSIRQCHENQGANSMRGKLCDISARPAHERRIRLLKDPTDPRERLWQATTYAMSISIPSEAAHTLYSRGLANLANRWRPGHGKRHPWRRRHEPYWGESMPRETGGK